MPSRALSRTQRIVLLCVLALGVLTMHHVNAAGVVHETVATFVVDAPTAAVTADSTPQHPACPLCGHDVLHACLAVLCATMMILLVLLAFLGVSHAATAVAASGPRGSPGPGGPPAEGGRAVLACLCVLRV